MKNALSWGVGPLSAVRLVDFCTATTKHCYLNRSRTIPYFLYQKQSIIFFFFCFYFYVVVKLSYPLIFFFQHMDQTVDSEPGLSNNLTDISYSHKQITLALEINAGLINIQKKKRISGCPDQGDLVPVVEVLLHSMMTVYC